MKFNNKKNLQSLLVILVQYYTITLIDKKVTTKGFYIYNMSQNTNFSQNMHFWNFYGFDKSMN